jgi:ArsR family transcriptional regulator
MTAAAPLLRFRALADPTRLRLLGLLADGEVCVGDLVAVLELPQGTVSRHLATLRRAGLAQVRRSGAWAFYSLDERVDPVRPLGRVVEQAISELNEVAADRARLAQRREEGGCC